jgi:hypothetical protein
MGIWGWARTRACKWVHACVGERARQWGVLTMYEMVKKLKEGSVVLRSTSDVRVHACKPRSMQWSTLERGQSSKNVGDLGNPNSLLDER